MLEMMPMRVFFKWQRFLTERAEKQHQPAPMREKTTDEMIAILDMYRPGRG